MARDAKTVTIGNHTYTVGMHGPDQGDEIVAYLARIAGPIGMAFAAGLDGDVFSPEVGKSLAGALAGVNGKEHARMMRLLLSVCRVNVPAGDGQVVQMELSGPYYDTHFTNVAPAERYQLAVETIRHNGFFGVIGALKAALPGTATGSSSPGT